VVKCVVPLFFYYLMNPSDEWKVKFIRNVDFKKEMDIENVF
jgi:hypothetical protein